MFRSFVGKVVTNMGKCEICGNDCELLKFKTSGKMLCMRCYQREWKRQQLKNPIDRKRLYEYRVIWTFLFGRGKKRKYDLRNKRFYTQEKLGLIPSGGCCWVCFEIDPFSLETHHITRKRMIPLCGTCHQILHRMGWEYLLEIRGRL